MSRFEPDFETWMLLRFQDVFHEANSLNPNSLQVKNSHALTAVTADRQLGKQIRAAVDKLFEKSVFRFFEPDDSDYCVKRYTPLVSQLLIEDNPDIDEKYFEFGKVLYKYLVARAQFMLAAEVEKTKVVPRVDIVTLQADVVYRRLYGDDESGASPSDPQLKIEPADTTAISEQDSTKSWYRRRLESMGSSVDTAIDLEDKDSDLYDREEARIMALVAKQKATQYLNKHLKRKPEHEDDVDQGEVDKLQEEVLIIEAATQQAQEMLVAQRKKAKLRKSKEIATSKFKEVIMELNATLAEYVEPPPKKRGRPRGSLN